MTINNSLIPQLISSVKELNILLHNSIKIGRVSNVDYPGKTIRVNTGLGITPFIRWISNSGANNTEWNPPKLDDIVAVLAPGGDFGQALALPFILSNLADTPETADIWQREFSNGMKFKVDTENNIMTLASNDGNTNISMQDGVITIDSQSEINIVRGANTVVVDSTKFDVDAGTINLTAMGTVNINAAAANVTAASIELTGAVNITGSGTINGVPIKTGF